MFSPLKTGSLVSHTTRAWKRLEAEHERSGTYPPSSRHRRVADLGQFKANRVKRLGVRSRKPLKNKTLQMQGLIEAERGGFEPPMNRSPYRISNPEHQIISH